MEKGTIHDPELTPPYWRYFARLIRPLPDFDLFFIKNLRRRAVEKLRLSPGERVLDVGCGSAASFPYLLDAVTDSGLVVGVEISPEIVTNAERRVRKHNWKNALIVNASAQDVTFTEKFDAVLMMGAPDIYASPSVLANVIRHTQPGARYAAFGAKLSTRFAGKAINPLFGSFFSKATFASTPKLDFEPWQALKECSVSFTVEEHFFGLMFLAWGELASQDKTSIVAAQHT